MVGIISSSGLGLFDSSADRLGSPHGNPTSLGQAKGSAYVNIATGNLSVQFLDESLSGTGADLSALRTYNSIGALNDGDLDGWRWNGEKKVVLTGTANTTSAVVTRTTGDGTASVFKWDGVANSNRYISTAGSDAHDTITWVAASSEWVYSQDSTGVVVERYNGSTGWIKSYRDNSGNGFDYTFSGNLLTVVKDLQSGQTLEFTYAGSKLTEVSTRTTATGALTKQVFYAYHTSGSSNGKLKSVTTDLLPDGSTSDGKVYTTNYAYFESADTTNTSAHGKLKSISQSDGTSTSFTYDTSGRISEVNDQTGKTTFAYDISSRTTIVKNGNGDNWAYTYNALGELVSHTSSFNNGVGQKASYTYDAQGNVKTITDGRDKTITYDYDASGNRIKEYDSLGNTITRTFSTGNLLLTETKYSVASTTSPGGAETTRYVYDTAGRVRFVISPEGRASEMRYNSWGLVTHTVQYISAKYTATSVLLADLQTWANTNKTATQITEFQYDYRGNLSKKTEFANVNSSGAGVIDNAATITEYTYSEHGQLLQTIAVRGTNRDQRTTLSSYGYDGMGRQITAVNDNVTTTTIYSGLNITVTNTATGLTTVSTTDASGRLVNLTQSGSSTNRITKYYYDNAGQLRMTEDPTGARSYLFYDHAGRVSAKVDAAGAATVYTRDNDGRVLTETRYATPTNSSGWFNGTTVTEGGLSIGTSGTNIIIDSANDRKTTYTYDDAGRLKTTTVDGLATVTNFYDGASRLIRIEQGDRITRYFYDKDSKQIGVLNAENYLAENIYDSVGRVIQTVLYGSKVTTVSDFTTMKNAVATGEKLTTFYYYDAQGRQTGVVNEQGFLTETVYDAVANRRQTIQYQTAVAATASDTLVSVKSRAGASYWTNTNYDNYGRVDTITQQNGMVSRNVYDSAGRLVRQIDGEGDPDWRVTHTRLNVFGEVTGVVTGDAALSLTVGTDSASINAVNTAITNNGTRYDIDGAGRKVAEYGPNGQKTFLFYNPAGQLTYVMNALGELSKTSYNTFGQVSEIRVYQNKLASADLALFTTGGLDTVISTKAVSNSNDKVVSSLFNKTGNLSTQTDGEGYQTVNSYNIFGELANQRQSISKSPATSVLNKWDRDKLGRVVWVERDTDTGGLKVVESQTVYDGFGRVKSVIDANGNTTSTAYQFNGRVVEITDPLGRKIKTEIDFQGRTLKSTDALGNVTSYSYDDAGRKFTITNADSSSITTWKTGRGETLKVQDANGNITQYAYNKDGKLKTVTDALNQIITDNTYDNSGRLYDSKDANGVITRYTYDAANRITYKTIDPSGLNLRTRYQFDGQGRQVYVTTGYGTDEASMTQYVYNRNDQIRQIIVDPNGLRLTTTFTYDGVGQTTKVEKGTNLTPAEQTTIYDYDKLGRKTSERIDPTGLNLTTLYQYDNNGNLIKKTDANGNVTQFAYNAANQLRYTINAEGTVSENIYDLNGNVTRTIVYQTPKTTGANTLADVDSFANPKRSDALNQNTYFAYDKNNRLRFTVGAEGAVSEKVYDANGNVVRTISYTTSKTTGANLIADLETFSSTNLSNSLNQISHFVYDKANRLRYSINAEGGVTEKVYDASNNLIRTINYSVIKSTGTNALTDLDSFGTTNRNDSLNRIANFAYDKANRLRFTVNADGSINENEYDANGNVLKTTQFAAMPALANDYSFTNINAKVNRADTNNRSTWFVFDVASRLVYTVNALGAVSENIYDSMGNVVSSVQYSTLINTALATSIFSVEMALNSWTQTFASNASGLTLPATNFSVASGQLVMSSVKTAAGTASTFPQSWGTARAVGTSFSYEFSTDGTTNSHYGTIGINSTDWKRRHALSQNGGTFYAEYVDAAGVVQTRNLGAIKDNTKYILEIETDAQGSTLYLYEATQTRKSAIVDRRNFSDWKDVSTWLLTGNVAGFTSSSTIYLDTVKESLPADARKTNFVYDKANRLRFTINAESYVTENTYDNFGNVKTLTQFNTKLTNPANYSEATINGAVTRNASLDRTTSYDYDKANRQKVTTLAGWYDVSLGKVFGTQTENDTLNPTDGKTDRFQRTVEVTYDAFGNAVGNKIRTGLGASDYVYQYKTYDKLNREINDIDGLGFVTQKSYDALGNLGSVTRGATSVGVKTSGFWVNSDIATQSGRKISYEYTKLGQQKKVTQPDGGYTESLFNSFGEVIKSTQKLNATEFADNYFYYDKLGRQVLSVDALGYGTQTEYTTLGDVWRTTEYADIGSGVGSTTAAPTYVTTNSLNRITTMTYDKLGQVKTTDKKYTDGSTTTVASVDYNSFGEAITNYSLNSQTNALTNITRLEYNKLGQMTKVVEPDRVVRGASNNVFSSQITTRPETLIEYDAFGQRLKETRRSQGDVATGASIITEHQYDLAGNEIGTKDGEDKWSYNAYDVSGKVIRQWQAVSASNAGTNMSYSHTIERRFEYDKAGRQVASVDIYSGQQSGQYNEYNGYGEVEKEYKVWGSAGVTAQSLSSNDASRAIVNSYVYNTAGQVQYKIGSDGYTHYFYDLAGRTTRVEQRGINNIDDGGKRVTEMVYSKLGQVTQQKLPQFEATSSFASTTTAMQTPTINRTYDRWGNLLTENGTTVSKTLTYNQDNQVLSEEGDFESMVTYSNASQQSKLRREFSYNKAGNLLVETQTAKTTSGSVIGTRNVSTNQYNQVGQLVFTQDAVQVSVGASVGSSYAYDIHGNRVGSKDAVGITYVDKFNRNGQLTEHSLMSSQTTSQLVGYETTQLPIYSTRTVTGTETLTTPKYDSYGSVITPVSTQNVLIRTDVSQVPVYADRTVLVNSEVRTSYKYDAYGQVITPNNTETVLLRTDVTQVPVYADRTILLNSEVRTSYKYDGYGQVITPTSSETVLLRTDVTQVPVYENRTTTTTDVVTALRYTPGPYGQVITPNSTETVIVRYDTVTTPVYSNVQVGTTPYGQPIYERRQTGTTSTQTPVYETRYTYITTSTQQVLIRYDYISTPVYETRYTYNTYGTERYISGYNTVSTPVYETRYTYNTYANERYISGYNTVSTPVYETRYTYNTYTQEQYISGYQTVQTPIYQTISNTLIAVARYQYDEAGRRYAELDAVGNAYYYKFDERNNLVREQNRTGGVKVFEYDELGHKTRELSEVTTSYNTYPNGEYGTPVVVYSTGTYESNRWSYKNLANTDFKDYAVDQLSKRMIAGNAALEYAYSYNRFGQTEVEYFTGDYNKRVNYTYWANGLQQSTTETVKQGYTTNNNTSTYYYDARGNRTVDYSNTSISVDAHTEYSAYGSVVVDAYSASTGSLTTYYQYDSLNRVSQVKAPSSNVSLSGGFSFATTSLTSMTFGYDEWGNRRRIVADYVLNGTAAQKNYWYGYDKADRIVIADGTVTADLTAATGGREGGVKYTYDNAGRRVLEEKWVRTASDFDSTLGSPTYGQNINHREEFEEKLYSYNDMGLVTQIQQRTNTRARWAYTSSPVTNYGGYATVETHSYDTRGFKTASVLGGTTNRSITYVYNKDGTLTNQTTRVTSTGRLDNVLSDYTYDSMGNVSFYRYTQYDIDRSDNKRKFSNDYNYKYEATYSGYQVSTISVKSSQSGTGIGTTNSSYDSRGRLVSAGITEAKVNDASKTGTTQRFFAYNAAGQIILKAELKAGGDKYKSQSYFYSPTGGELANIGDMAVDITPLDAINEGNSTPGSYTVNAGDTLMGIAQTLFGDAKLWYLIADANGLAMGPTNPFGGSDVGRNLRIPNNDKAIANTSNNWKPYNPTEMVGDLTPQAKIVPPAKKGCNAFAIILMVVVAVVLTIVTAGAAATMMGATGGIWSAGTAALSGSLATVGATAGTFAATSATAAGMAAAAVGGFVGSVGSQLVGKGLGVVEHFSLRQAVGSGLTAGFASGAGAAFNGMKEGLLIDKVATASKAAQLSNYGYAARGAATYLGAYASNKVAGLETHFSWKDMAVASIGSVINQNTGNKMVDGIAKAGYGVTANTISNMWGGVVNTGLSAAFGRGRTMHGDDWGAMAADAFGNALATKTVEVIQERSNTNNLIKNLKKKLLDEKIKTYTASMGGGGIRQTPDATFLENMLDSIVNKTPIAESAVDYFKDKISDLPRSVQENIGFKLGAGDAVITDLADLGKSVYELGKLSLKLQAQQAAWMVREVTGFESSWASDYDQTMETMRSVWENRDQVLSDIGSGIKKSLVDDNIARGELSISHTRLGNYFEGSRQAGIVAARLVMIASGIGGLAKAGVKVVSVGAKAVGKAIKSLGIGDDVLSKTKGSGAVDDLKTSNRRVVDSLSPETAEVYREINISRSNLVTPRQPTIDNKNISEIIINSDGSKTVILKSNNPKINGLRVNYDAEGYPDFSSYLYEGGPNTVKMKLTGSRNADAEQANRLAGYGSKAEDTPDGYTWHHHQDLGTMELVKQGVHKLVPHTGGVSIWQKAFGFMYDTNLNSTY